MCVCVCVCVCGVYFTERNGTERNAGLFHGTDECDRGTINLILEYLVVPSFKIKLYS